MTHAVLWFAFVAVVFLIVGALVVLALRTLRRPVKGAEAALGDLMTATREPCEKCRHQFEFERYRDVLHDGCFDALVREVSERGAK